MALGRLGPRGLAEVATRRPGRVLAAWGVILLLAIGSTALLMDSAITPDTTMTNDPESLRAQDLVDERLPERDPVDELVVIRSEEMEVDSPGFREHVRGFVADAHEDADVDEIVSYLSPGGEMLVSEDGHATLLPVLLGGDEEERVDDLIGVVERADEPEEFAVRITGQHTAERDFLRISSEDLTTGELRFGLPAAMVVLLLVFGTLVGALVPLVMALVSIITALGILAVIGQLFELNLFVLNMVVAMGLALGIDYSLFIVSRLREERARGSAHRDAIMKVSVTATRAVVFSGTAFAFALIGMLLVPDTTLRSLGLGAVVVAIVSVGVALTFHPALLMVLGDRIDRLAIPWLGRRVAGSAGQEGRFWGGVVRRVVRRPAVSLAAAVLVLLAAASPVVGMQLGASGAETLPPGTVAREGVVALERDFPSGATQPVDVVVEGDPEEVGDALERLDGLLRADPDFAVEALTRQAGPGISVVSVPLEAEPASEAASLAVDRLRERHVPAAFGPQEERVLVGGGPAQARDYFRLVETWLPIVIAFVLGLSFVLLTLAFRSIVVPLTAIVVNLLSVGAAYGLLVLVFQEGVGAGLFGFREVDRIEAWVPVFLFSVLFGLSMDYQVFLLSRIREHTLAARDTTVGIVHGVASTARLITGAALIIVMVFIGFATGELTAFQQVGFGVAVALLIDATIVRSVVIPAAMQLLGERNWYLPRWLAWLPHISIEGPVSRAGGGRD